MRFTRNGYWIRRYDHTDYVNILFVMNHYDTFKYDNGNWVPVPTAWELGWSDEWDPITEQEAFDIINNLRK